MQRGESEIVYQRRRVRSERVEQENHQGRDEGINLIGIQHEGQMSEIGTLDSEKSQRIQFFVEVDLFIRMLGLTFQQHGLKKMSGKVRAYMTLLVGSSSISSQE
ncbi:hypothetical protein M5K25_027463 [Dendrobium thyrsiflorum]|uniref:Uncharacterized protein n=1 Tax=Dendrobium thyrsiflorum TaxID=117978 RepID=A0ABD0TZZ2_DENTH